MKVRSNSSRLAAWAVIVCVAALAAFPGCEGCRNGKKPGTGSATVAEKIPLPPTSHPAAAGREYEYIDKVWENEQEREFVDLLSRTHTAERAFRMVKGEPAELLPTLYRAIRSANPEVRIQSVIITGLMRDANTPEASAVLLDALILDSKPEVRAVCAKSLVMVKAAGALPALVQSLDLDPYEGARANAAWALGELGDPSAIPILRKATRDDDAFVRLRAVGALMDLKSRIAIPELIDRLVDENVMVRERAHQALRQITGTDKGRDPAEWRRVFGKPLEENLPDARDGGAGGAVRTAPDAGSAGAGQAGSNGN